MKKLATLLESPTFDDKLKSSIKDPDGFEARYILKTLTPLLRTIGKHIPWGPLERSNELSVLYSMQQRYVPHSLFITFSQISATQPLVIRLGSRKFKKIRK